MKILLISYGDLRFDGRLRSLIHVFSQVGEVYSFTRGDEPLNDTSKIYNGSYFGFIRKALSYAKDLGAFEWLVLDNRKATIPGLVIQRKLHPSVMIQDCRELYLMNEVPQIASKVGCFFEKIAVRKADIVICANQERAKILKKEYDLAREPLTYENLRQLQYGTESEMVAAKACVDPYIREGEFRILSSSGCSLARTNDILVENISKVEKPCRLFLVGESAEKEKKAIQSIIDTHHLTNVHVLGRLNQSELKYLISKCHIGIVNYGQYDTNNRLCASGKLYEFLYEGIPVVTTTNPPLKRMCEEERIGIADDTYYNGINKVISDYNSFKINVKTYAETHTEERNNEMFVEEIKQVVNQLA